MTRLDRRIKVCQTKGLKLPKLPRLDTVKWIINTVAEETLSSSSQLKKSVTMGWKYHDVPMEEVPPQVASLAVDALEAADLDLGAVSVSLDGDGVARALAITTAPNLSKEQIQRYVDEMSAFTSSQAPRKRERKKNTAGAEEAPPELRARLYQRMKNVTTEKAKKALKSLEE
jgi:hypothetical protein